MGGSKIIILAIVENVSEGYHNLKTIIDLINLSTLQSSSNNFKYAFDMKLANVFFGIGTASSTYPCSWCDLPKNYFTNPLLSMENKYLRTIGSIKENALKYQAAASKHKGKKKLTSAPFFSCEQLPLCGSNIDDSTLVIDLLPPMELHILLGITNVALFPSLLYNIGIYLSEDT